MLRTLNLAIAKLKTLVVGTCVLAMSNFLPPASHAQQELGIAAVVNEEMISMYDLNSRLDAVIAFAGFSNTSETRRKLISQVLRSLIDERIKSQEAKRLDISVGPGKMKSEKASFERQSGMKPGQLKAFIKQHELQESTVDDQLEVRSLWSQLVNSYFSRGILITDDEVNETLEKLKSNKGKPEDLVLEIFLPVNQPTEEQDVTRLAQRLIQQIKKGANFSAIAQNFSKSSSASNGGSLGWTLRGQQSADLNAIVQTLRPGQLSGPIRTQDGIYIVFLQATRASRGLDGPPPGPEKVRLYQFHLTLPVNPAPELVSQRINLVRAETKNVRGCVNMDKLAKTKGSPLSGELGIFEISKISKQMQSLVKNVPVGQVSSPQQIPEGVIVLMVCDRIVPKVIKRSPKEQRRAVRGQLISERLNLAAKRYLRDLRRASFIEIRLGKQ